MKAMTETEHQEYWIREFTRRMWGLTDADEWHRLNKLRAQAIKEWRKHKTLFAV